MYWVRSIFALAGIAAAMLMFYDGPPGRIARGDSMLWLLSVVALALALFSGCLLTADCISSEKRDDTLGLLFLTSLKGYDIVAGKLATHAITTACGLLSVFPVFFLPVLAGGVTWTETLRVLLGITVAFLLALTLGVWISTRSRDARNAMMVALTALSLLLVLPLLWIWILDEFFRANPSPVGVPQLSPGMLLFYARDSWYSGPRGAVVYWTSIGLFVTANAVLAGLASRSLPRSWGQEALPRANGAPLRIRRFPRFPWKAARRARRPLHFRSPNPFQDLFLSRLRVLPAGRWFQRLLTFFVLVLVLLGTQDDDPLAFAILLLFFMHAMAKFAFAFDSVRALGEDKRSSALELLLATPSSDRAIPEGLAEAFRIRYQPQARRLIWLTIAVQAAALLNHRLRGDDLFFVSSFLWGAVLWTRSDYRTICWAGMGHALRQGSHLKAMLRTIGTMLIPWAPYFVVLFVMANARASEEAAAMVTLVWAICAAGYQAAKTRGVRSRLVQEFRQLASASGPGPARIHPLKGLMGLFPEGSGARWIVRRISALAAKRSP